MINTFIQIYCIYPQIYRHAYGDELWYDPQDMKAWMIAMLTT